MKKKFSFLLSLLSGMYSATAQCAMCRAVVESGGEETAQGINNGIVYLMAFPYLIAAIGLYVLYRSWKKNR